MAGATAVRGGYLPASFRRSPLELRCQNRAPAPPPLYFSTNPTDVNPLQLKELFTLCNQSGHRFPKVDPTTGRAEPIDLHKLRIALYHSSIIVSVFAKPEDFSSFTTSSSSSDMPPRTLGIGGVWIQKMMPVTPGNSQLVGFGRAVTDFGLTASIYDVMVTPSLQGRGIGRKIVQKIIRMLTRREVYDIAAVCSDDERTFFRACGFGDDILGSTTMMYSRISSSSSEDTRLVAAGRKLLLVPPIRQHFKYSSESER